MAYFNDEQMLQILSATNPNSLQLVRLDENNNALGRQSDIDAKYGSQASSQPPIIVTRAPNPPEQITMTNEIDSFSCPVPGAADCFSRIPREDISQVITANQSNTKQQINLDNVRGMHLCTMSGLLVITDPLPTPTEGPTVKEQEQFYDQLFFFGAWSLRFRGQQVPEFTDRPLSELISEPGCCDAPLVHVGCRIPQYGGLEFELNVSQITLPNWVGDINVAVRMRYSGCGCNQSAGCGCGCGSGVKGPNRYIIKPSGGTLD